MSTWLFTSLPRSSFLELLIAVRLSIIPLLVGSIGALVVVLHVAFVVRRFHSNIPFLYFILGGIACDVNQK